MNAAMKLCQLEYDNRLPAESDASAEQAWIENGVEQLMLGADVTFKRRLHAPQGVTQEQFAIAVDEFVMDRLSEPGISNSVLGRLVLAAHGKASADAASAANEALSSPDPKAALRQIAVRLLAPLARAGVLAHAEDDEL